MRYRRLSCRYAMVLTAGGPRPLGAQWPGERLTVVIARPHWCPPADIYETADAIHVTVELAGVSSEDLEVILYEDAVAIEGERRLPPYDAAGVYHTAEIRQGSFRLELPLPAPIDPHRIDGQYEQGMLRLTLAKPGGATP